MEAHTNGNGRRIKEWTIGGVSVASVVSIICLGWQKVEDNGRRLDALDGQVKALVKTVQGLQKKIDRVGGMME